MTSAAIAERPTEDQAREAAKADPRITRGSRWRTLYGDHAGQIIEVVRVTATSVVCHPIKTPGISVPNGTSFDEAATWARPLRAFLTQYSLAMPAPSQAPKPLAQPSPTQPRFRQENAPKRPPKPAPSADAYVPQQGLLQLRDAEFNMSLETIMPERAREWLDRGGLNRHRNQSRVDALVAAIRRGEWQITGDTIKLDKSGRVRDGQHRLAAIAEGGIAVQTLVVFGVADDAFDVMDTGRSRTVADVLGMRGYTYRTGLSGAVRNLLFMEHLGRFEPTIKEARAVVTSASTLKYLADHPEVPEVMPRADALRLAFLGGIGVWAALVTMIQRSDPVRAEDFFGKLLAGDSMEANNPILVLRNRMLSRTVVWDSRDKETLAVAVIKAWNGFKEGKAFKSWRDLAWRANEPFPRPL